MQQPFLSIEQKVECLAQQVGQLKEQLQLFLRVSTVSLHSGLADARKIIEYFVGRILRDEGIEADRDLHNNIEILGGKDGKFPARRRKGAEGPVPPPFLPAPLYSSLHNLRIYGNLVVHPSWDPDSLEPKDVHVTSTDLQVALGQILRLAEWYFQEYARGPHLEPLYQGLPEPVVGAYGAAPPDPARFLGRATERARLGELLEHGPARVVTVLAPAGMGKTLLAARAALDVASRWAPGRGVLLWLDLKRSPSFGEVSASALASLEKDTRPTDLTIAQMPPAARVEQIVRRMAERPVLLVLDNLESWLDPYSRQPLDPHVAELLRQCATRSHQGRVVLTSRALPELGGVPADCLADLSLGPLPLEDGRALLRTQGVEGSDPAVADAWRRLEGNPRLLLMLAEVLLKRRCRDLDRGLARYPKLVAEKADSLLAEVWGELSAEARLVLQALAVLRPPAAVAEVEGLLRHLPSEAADAVEGTLWDELVPRALAVPADDGSGFAVEHLLIRDYALRQWPDVAAAHRAAVRSYQEVLAARPDPAAFDPAHLAVIRHALACGDAELAARVLTSDAVRHEVLLQGRVLDFWEISRRVLEFADRLSPVGRFGVRRVAAVCLDMLGNYPEACRLLEACRGEPGEWRGTREECGLLRELCAVLRKMQRYDAAESAGQEALALAGRLGLVKEKARALIELSALSRNRGRPSRRLATQALEVAEQTGDLRLRTDARIHWGRILVTSGNPDQAGRLFWEALDLGRQAGAVGTEAMTLENLANLARVRGDYHEAMRLVGEAINIFQRIGDRTGEGIARHCRGLTLYQTGSAHRPEALAELRRAVRLAFDLDHRGEVAAVLTSLARLFDTAETLPLAAVCLRTASALHGHMGHDWKKGPRCLAQLRASAEAAGTAWAEVERAVAGRPAELLEQATAIDADSWRRFLDRSAAAAAGPAV